MQQPTMVSAYSPKLSRSFVTPNNGIIGVASGAAIISTDELRRLREDLISGKGEAAREAAILSKDEIERMKRSTKI